MLKIGSKGNLVKLLQEKLGVTTDGDFGPKTERALKEWQTKNGLTADGIASQVTLSKMGIEIPTIKKEELKLNKLVGHVPKNVIDEITSMADKFNITTNLRLAHFLSQCSHESNNFRALTENLNYSKDGLMRIFPRHFPNNLAESYAHQPERIASRVYGSRMGNGDETSKEGWKYRGRGAIQLTGKQNYEIFSRFIGEDCVTNPDLVATKYPVSSAAFFFNNNNLWTICDEGSTDDVVTKVTRRVNGGTNGLAHRLQEFKKFNSLLS
jgi:putative chitinase